MTTHDAADPDAAAEVRREQARAPFEAACGELRSSEWAWGLLSRSPNAAAAHGPRTRAGARPEGKRIPARRRSRDPEVCLSAYRRIV